MANVLLVTIQNVHNYGNRLQNYALQTVLENLGCRVDNLSVHRLDVYKNQKLHYLAKRALVNLGMKKYRYGAAISARRYQMAAFSTKYIHRYLFLTRDEVDSYDFSRYDAAVVGSDQVWHHWHGIARELAFYYLTFIDPSKRIAYAPSFGFSAFPEEDAEEHRRGLTEMAALSCREQTGCEMIRSLTGRTAQKVLDPTLLLTAEDWSKIEKKPHFRVPDKYLLQFVLGGITNEYRAELAGIAKQRGLAIVDINRTSDYLRYGISPGEFIWLIHHADTVCTDSFHTAVFTVTFGNNLRVFERVAPELGNMFGRLHDLLGPLHLAGNIFGAGEALSTKLDADARRYLEEEREQSIRYLRKSLGLEKGCTK